MSKELIERLRNAAIFATSECAWLMTEAADALEDKAAPVGEREAAIEAAYAAVRDGGWDSVKDMGIQMFQAGAAYQRAQQPQSAEAVAWMWYERSSEFNGYDGRPRISFTKPKGGATPLYTTPQPSAGVVMPEGYALVPQRMHLSEEAIESITVHCGDGQDDAGYGPYQGGVLWVGEIEEEDGTKTYGLHIATADYPEHGSTTLAEFARLNGKEVGRG